MKHRAVTFLAQATLLKKGSGPSPYLFSLAHLHDGGIPADVAFSDKRAKLARVDVAVRSFGPGQMGSLVLQPRPADGLIYAGPFLGDSLLDLGTLPRTVRTYRSPGLRWTTLATLVGRALDGRPVRGHRRDGLRGRADLRAASTARASGG